jgi:aryl-alcohol dehydrogenase-like predicted oxidoreductase
MNWRLSMEYRTLGRTGLKVPVIGFGAWAAGGDMWGPQNDKETILALKKSFELGCNFIDTAAVYGMGHSEEVIGQFLKETKADPLIATKVPPKNFRWPAKKGTHIRDAFPKDHIIEQTEKSLKRMKLDHVDLQQLHVWTEEWIDSDEWLSAMNKLKEQGKIRFFGVSINAFDADSGVELVRKEVVDSIQVVYNIFEQAPEDMLFPEAVKHNIGMIARVPFDESSLTGKLTAETIFDPNDFRARYFKGDKLKETVARVEELKPLASKYGETLVEMALRFSFTNKAVSTSIPGIRNVRQAEENVGAGSLATLPQEAIEELRKHRWDRDWRI